MRKQGFDFRAATSPDFPGLDGELAAAFEAALAGDDGCVAEGTRRAAEELELTYAEDVPLSAADAERSQKVADLVASDARMVDAETGWVNCIRSQGFSVSSFEEGELYLMSIRSREASDAEMDGERAVWLEARQLCDDDYFDVYWTVQAEVDSELE